MSRRWSRKQRRKAPEPEQGELLGGSPEQGDLLADEETEPRSARWPGAPEEAEPGAGGDVSGAGRPSGDGAAPHPADDAPSPDGGPTLFLPADREEPGAPAPAEAVVEPGHHAREPGEDRAPVPDPSAWDAAAEGAVEVVPPADDPAAAAGSETFAPRTGAAARPEADGRGPGQETIEGSGSAAPEAVPPEAATATGRASGERLARARDLVASGRVEEAIDLYHEILQQHPESVKALNNLGVLYDELGRHAAAFEHLSAAERVEPDNVEVLTNLGSTLGSLARFDEAERHLRRALRIAPESTSVRAALGILSFRKGAYAQAEPDLRWVCEHDGEHGQAHYYRGEALNRMGRQQEALAALERATELLPTDPRVYSALGRLYDRMHRPEEAAAMYRRARSLPGP